MNNDPNEPRPLDGVKCTLVETWDEAQDLLVWLGERREFLGFDIETQGLNVGRDDIRLCQFGDPKRGWSLDWSDWKGLVKEVVQRYDRKYVAHNLIFDSKFLKREGIIIPQHLAHDSMVMAHIWDPRYSIGLEASGARYIDRRSFVGKKALSAAYKGGGWDFRTIPTDHPAYWAYGACDTVLTSLLGEELWPEIQPFREIYDVELACIHVLRDAALRGMRIDVEYTELARGNLESKIAELQQRIPFEPSKDALAIDWIQTELKKKGHKGLTETTDKGELSLDDEVLLSVEDELPTVVPFLRKWRKYSRLVNAYFSNFMDMHTDGVLYPSVKVLGARTGRMSVTEPALQTLPRGSIVRNSFISRDGATMLLADYEQAELRVLASYAKEQAMIEAFERGDDLHDWVAEQAYGKAFSDAQRQIAKNVQFGKVYGAGNAKLALTAEVEREVIDEFVERYNELFPGIPTFMAGLMQQVRDTEFHNDPRDGYITTVLGRRLPVEKDKAYKACNYLVQSSATADLLKLKLVELSNAGLGENILLPVHDEIVFEAPDDEMDELMATVKDVMPEYNLFDAPITIDMDTTKRWGTKYRKFDKDDEPIPTPTEPPPPPPEKKK